MREFWEGLAKMGISFDKHKNAVTRALVDCICDEEPVFDSDEEMEEYFAHPAGEILDLALWDDEDIVKTHCLNRDTTINQLIKVQNEKALQLYDELVKTPEEDWERMLDEKIKAYIKELAEESLQAHLSKLGISFEKHKKAAYLALENYFGGAPGFDSEEDERIFYSSYISELFDASDLPRDAILDRYGDNDDMSFDDMVSCLGDEAQDYYDRLITAPEEKWDEIK